MVEIPTEEAKKLVPEISIPVSTVIQLQQVLEQYPAVQAFLSLQAAVEKAFNAANQSLLNSED